MDLLAPFIGEKESDMVISPFWKWASTEHQQILALHLGLSKWRLIADIPKYGISHIFMQISVCDVHYPIMEMNVNRASTILVF